MPRYSDYPTYLQDLQQGNITCVEMLEYYFAKIEASKSNNIYIEVFKDEALAKAKELDQKEGPKGKLFGMVISIKDNICYAGKSCTAASKILEGFVSTYTATAIEKLEAEDAIIIGRVNCDEFGMGSASSHSTYGQVKHPEHPEHVPGGSSGGCAAAVLADTCFASIGTDTGGSVRQPAAFCGLVGAKPSYGSISRYGIIAYASSFDQVGVLTHQVEEAQLLLDIMSGIDDKDPTTVHQSNIAQAPTDANKKIKVAFFHEAFHSEGLDLRIQKESLQFLENLKAQGHEVEAVPFEYLDLLVPTYYVLTTAEASSNLARFDGVRYGFRAGDTKNLEELYRKTRTEGFGDEVKRRIMLGTFVLSASYYDAYYTKAQKTRRLIAERMFQIFEHYDYLVLPTAPEFPWKIGTKHENPVSTYLADIFTVLANLIGSPAVSIPLSTSNKDFKVNIQILSAKHKELDLFGFASNLQNLILS